MTLLSADFLINCTTNPLECVKKCVLSKSAIQVLKLCDINTLPNSLYTFPSVLQFISKVAEFSFDSFICEGVKFKRPRPEQRWYQCGRNVLITTGKPGTKLFSQQINNEQQFY